MNCSTLFTNSARLCRHRLNSCCSASVSDAVRPYRSWAIAPESRAGHLIEIGMFFERDIAPALSFGAKRKRPLRRRGLGQSTRSLFLSLIGFGGQASLFNLEPVLPPQQRDRPHQA